MKSSRFKLPRALRSAHEGNKKLTIGVGALSGAVDPARLERGVARLQSLGYRVIVAPHAADSHEYFSSPDDVRLSDFHALVANPEIDLMMMARGGYGLSRLLHRIDWQSVRASPKMFCGFSDFTAFNLAALSQAGLVTIAGAMTAVDFGDIAYEAENAEAHEFMQSHWQRVVAGEHDAIAVESSHPYAPATLEGTLWGSNLSLVAHLVGTPFMPAIDGGILFLEEIAEEPYAVERMLFQLFHAGVLQSQRAIILGGFTDCEPSNGRFPYSMMHVLKTLRALVACPVLTDLPFGHVPRKLSLPFGADATLTIAEDRYSLAF